eukprot:6486777-Amphidinium_carterae.1
MKVVKASFARTGSLPRAAIELSLRACPQQTIVHKNEEQGKKLLLQAPRRVSLVEVHVFAQFACTARFLLPFSKDAFNARRGV